MSYRKPRTPEERLTYTKTLSGLPPVVAMFGSTRFMTELNEAHLRETEAGRIVVKPAVT